MSHLESWSEVHVGTVISTNQWSDTHVSSSGGGGHVGQHGGYISAPTVHSNVIQRTVVFSRDDTGEEQKLDLSRTGLAFRDGSRLLAVWGAEDGTKNGPYLYVENLDTKETYAPVKELIVNGWGFFNGLGAGLLVAALGLALCFGALIATTSLDSFESVSKPDYAAMETEISLAIEACPPGKKTTEVRQYIPQTCSKGVPKKDPKKLSYWCECEQADVIKNSKKFLYENGQGKRIQVSMGWGSVLLVASFLSVAAGFLAWLHFGIKKSQRLRQSSTDLRSKFVDEIVSKAEKKNISLGAKNLDPLIFYRT